MKSTGHRVIAIFCLSLLLALAAGYGLIQREVTLWKPRLIDFVRLHYSLNCELDDLDYAFPDGIRVTRLKMSAPEKPLLEIAEATIRIHLFEYLKNRSLSWRILKSAEVLGANIRLERLASGAWIAPVPLLHPQRGESAAGSFTFPGYAIRLSVRDLGLNILTPRGAMTKQYDRLDALFDPRSGTGNLSLLGGDEKVKIAFRMNPERRVEMEADSLSLQPLLLFTSPILPYDRLFLKGNAVIRESSPGRIALVASGSIFGKGSDKSLKIPVSMEGTGTPAGPEEIRGKMALDGEGMEFSVTTIGGRKPAVQVSATFPDFSFERAVAAVPLSFRPNLPDLRVTGYLKGTFSASIATAPPYRTAYRFSGESRPLKVLALGPGIRISELKRPFSHTFRTEEGKSVTIRVGPENPDFIPYDEIPRDLIRAVLTTEDGGFFRHRGISVLQIIEATADNVRAGRVVRGASTITMQLAKNLYLRRERTLGRKFEEFFITLALEEELSKERLLEIYLNIIEWGDGIYGLGPAARHYFRKAPDELTDVECAFLASIIARPKDRWKPDPLSKVSVGWQQYLDLIMRKMSEKTIP